MMSDGSFVHDEVELCPGRLFCAVLGPEGHRDWKVFARIKNATCTFFGENPVPIKDMCKKEMHFLSAVIDMNRHKHNLRES